MQQPLTTLHYCVLDVLRYDIEPLESILKLVNDDGCIGWRFLIDGDFTAEQIATLLAELLRRKAVRKIVPAPDGTLTDAALDDVLFDAQAYYGLTDVGWNEWSSWDPPLKPGDA